MLIEIFLTLIAGICGLFVFLYYLQKGQFEEHEDVKYQMFRENDQE